MTDAPISIIALCQQHDFDFILSRAKFEQICQPFFNKLIPIVTKALEEAKMSKAVIDEIVMVGGSTYIPKVRNIVEEYFGKPLNYSVNPDEAVCAGAAIQAAILSGHRDK